MDVATWSVAIALAALFAAWAAIPVGNPLRKTAVGAGVVVLLGFALLAF